MIPVYQRTGAKTGEQGDCFTACLASLFHLPMNKVPNFNEGAMNGQPLPAASSEALREWLQPKGCEYIEIGFHVPSKLAMLAQMGSVTPNMYYFLIGRTGTYTIHSVVAKGGEIVHDPASPVGQDCLRGPCHDGFWRVGFFPPLL
jgi:hypothetical protein